MQHEDQTLAISPDQLALIKSTVALGATDAELQLFMYDCQRQGVHPLDRLIHFTKRGNKYTPITSIDFMRSRASSTGQYAGNDDPEFEGTPQKPDFKATATVYRLINGGRTPFVASARWTEYYPGEQLGFIWRKMPHTMLGKCAEALALRKAFPRHLFGLYTEEELDQAKDGQLIKRAKVPKLKDNLSAAPVLAEAVAEGRMTTGGEARESTSQLQGPRPDNSRGGAQKLRRKKQEILPNQAAMLARLKEIGKTPEDLMKVLFDNDWITDQEKREWPLLEITLSKFLDDENWSVVKAELEALK